MIQRIQSIYLFIVTALGIFQCCSPFASVKGLTLGLDNCYIYAGLTVLIPIVSFVSIFLFKKRILQMRVNSFNIILMIFQIISMVAYFFYFKSNYTVEEILPTHILGVFAIPFINIILTYLAIRAIGKDEALVRSLDRLR
ncbi:MAG: DUF4293 domain-containing protein [Paludibacteraceae bacterium]|nr:DUF4293 domain-containing protein [Paludibacteraceae bacterium]MBR6686666.1 DUF4293 domain-containing protein [Paludibacteraceae bacterium]